MLYWSGRLPPMFACLCGGEGRVGASGRPLTPRSGGSRRLRFRAARVRPHVARSGRHGSRTGDALMHQLHFLQDLLVLLGLGVVVVVLFSRARIPPIVGFLITGVLCGPYGFALI